ncbi:MAG: hypothetical protein R3Y61_07675 [Rikenellaceae bacterium]
MKNLRYILLVIAATMAFGCMKVIDDLSGDTTDLSENIVEVLEDGRFKVTAQLNGVSMTSVVTRATADEDRIYDGWCLVFGEDEDNVGKGNYSDDSPLIQLERVTINANGTFTMVFDEYPNTAFMRIVVNLTDREDYNLENYITSWRMAVQANPNDGISMNTPPTRDQVSKYGIATFGQYRHQSVGLDGIYDMSYTTTSTIVDYAIEGYGFTSTSGDKGYKDVVDYSDYGNPQVTSVVRHSVNYQTSGGKTGTSTVTDLGETYNINKPDPASPKITGFPMSSYGFMMSEISEETLENAFESVIDMIRVCSKVQVSVSDATFDMEEVYLIDAAQESRIRSSVLQTTGVGGTTEVSSSFSVPVNLGGTIDYMVQSTDTKSSDPIYFYPNSGGGYVYNEGAVNQDINPQYIIIKGQSSNYDTPGYYKIALKAEYPLDATGTTTSGLTYDILRNTSFTVNLLEIDKPGYKTYEDAADADSPANNISYSIEIETSDNRYEVLVSKGTYWAELETSRVYIKGYMDEGIEGCYIDFTMTPTEGNSVPTVYVQSSNHDGIASSEDVVITHCLVRREGDSGYGTSSWDDATKIGTSDNKTEDGLSDKLVMIESSKEATEVRIYFDATDSGRIRLRIGDMLKFIPVVYDRRPISIYGTIGQDGTEDKGVVVEDSYGTSWDDFSYSKVEYDEDYEGDDAHAYVAEFQLTPQGTVTYENSSTSVKPELRARIYPKDAGDGNAVLYLRQASDFILMNNGTEIKDDSYGDQGYSVEFHSQSMVEKNNTNGLFTTSSNGKSIVFSVADINTESIDALTTTIDTDITTKTETGGSPGWDEYFNEEITDDGQTLTLSATTIPYDLADLSLTAYPYDASGTISVTSGNHKYARQAYVAALKKNTLVLYNNTATSTVSVTNAAGDVKTYTVQQTQYPPIYLIDASGQDLKQYSVSTGSNDETCVFALNIWNYDLNEGDLEYSYARTDGTSWSVYLSAFRNNTMTFTVGGTNSTYISNYNWPSYSYYYSGDYYTYSGNGTGGDVAATSMKIPDLDGDDNDKTIEEISNMGGYNEAEYIFGVVRSQNATPMSWNVYWTLTITVTDKYDYTYTTVKYLKATT